MPRLLRATLVIYSFGDSDDDTREDVTFASPGAPDDTRVDEIHWVTAVVSVDAALVETVVVVAARL